MSRPSSSDGNGRVEVPQEGAGVLGNLPRTRPQRATARRAAARGSSAKAAVASAEKPRSSTPRKRSAGTATATKAAKAPARGGRAGTGKPKAGAAKRQASARRAPARAAKRAPALDPAPRQGYECLEERATGPVTPPGGADLVNTAAEALSELAKAGISGGERVLRDVISLFAR